MKALYIFSGTRKNRFKGTPGVDYPDTQFYGMNHLDNFGINAEFKEFESYPFGKLVAKIIGFRAKHAFMYFVAQQYDVVFGISVIYMLFWKKVFKTKTKFIIFNSVFSRMLNIYKDDSYKFKLLKWFLYEADGIVFLSHADMEKLSMRMPFLREKLFFVSMGVDTKYLKPEYENRDNFFLSVGRDNARDYKTVVEVARKLPEETFHFVCLPRNIEGIDNLPSNVHIHVNIPRLELENLYKKAKALLLITHNDSFTEGSDSSGPTVLLEAMATGLPIIVSKKAYVFDYGSDKKDMYFVDFYDSDAIVESIQAISDDNIRLQMAKSARLKVEKIFNTKEMARNLAEVFKTVCAK